MAPPKKYRNTTPFLFNPELDMFNEFKELCHRERKSVAQKLNELIVQAVETHAIGGNNPLGIKYGPAAQQKITNFSTNNAIEMLKRFIDSGVIGLKEWQPVFAELEDQEQMKRIVNLIETMNIAAKARLSFVKTGKVVVRSGIEERVPSFKDISTAKVRF